MHGFNVLVHICVPLTWMVDTDLYFSNDPFQAPEYVQGTSILKISSLTDPLSHFFTSIFEKVVITDFLQLLTAFVCKCI